MSIGWPLECCMQRCPFLTRSSEGRKHEQASEENHQEQTHEPAGSGKQVRTHAFTPARTHALGDGAVAADEAHGHEHGGDGDDDAGGDGEVELHGVRVRVVRGSRGTLAARLAVHPHAVIRLKFSMHLGRGVRGMAVTT
jgi:hypothetical protein